MNMFISTRRAKLLTNFSILTNSSRRTKLLNFNGKKYKAITNVKVEYQTTWGVTQLTMTGRHDRHDTSFYCKSDTTGRLSLAHWFTGCLLAGQLSANHSLLVLYSPHQPHSSLPNFTNSSHFALTTFINTSSFTPEQRLATNHHNNLQPATLVGKWVQWWTNHHNNLQPATLVGKWVQWWNQITKVVRAKCEESLTLFSSSFHLCTKAVSV